MTVFNHNRPLLDAFRRGEHAALTQVYLAYVEQVEQLVWRLLDRHLGQAEAALVRDLIQDIFIKAFAEKARDNFDGLRAYQPYLMQIARNRVVDYLRRSDVEIVVENINDFVESEPVQAAKTLSLRHENSPEQQAHWHRLRLASLDYINSLSPLLQDFVRLRFEQELTQKELSQRLGLSRWKVRSTEKKLQKGLRRFLLSKQLIEK